MSSASNNRPATLDCIDPFVSSHTFIEPTKRIDQGEDVSLFLTSKAYTDIVTFLLQLTASMFPRRQLDGSTQVWEINSPAIRHSSIVIALRSLLSDLSSMIDSYPPATGPRRFGNVAFKSWYAGVEGSVDALLDRYLPDTVVDFKGQEGTSARAELRAYLLGSFGSAQRLDYGTGHELSFLAFLGCLWKLGAFQYEAEESVENRAEDGAKERALVLGVVEPYLNLIRRLIKTYTLEPAGSHGVWGLDDHSFLPFIFGSAQLSPAISNAEQIPTEGSLPDAPHPGDVTKAAVVERERIRNMYFGAVGFINDVKRGPFWEHSPILYDVSGVTAGWAKINKGMIKMYIAEVLSKFPVVQHFPFGSLFKWEQDPNVRPLTSSAHVASQPPSDKPRPQVLSGTTAGTTTKPSTASVANDSTRAPWAAQPRVSLPNRSDNAALPLERRQAQATGMMAPTRAPWSPSAVQIRPSTLATRPEAARVDGPPGTVLTRAPWAK